MPYFPLYFTKSANWVGQYQSERFNEIEASLSFKCHNCILNTCWRKFLPWGLILQQKLLYYRYHVTRGLSARKLNKEDVIDRCKWRKMIKDVRPSGWVWVGECLFWYRPTRVVPDKRPLNGCVCVSRTEQMNESLSIPGLMPVHHG